MAAATKESGELAIHAFASEDSHTPSITSQAQDIGRKDQEQMPSYTSREPYGIYPSKHNGTFDTISNSSFYTPIDGYEGKHRYDPTFEWEPKEEKKLVRKVNNS